MENTAETILFTRPHLTGMHPSANSELLIARLGRRGVECAAGDAGRSVLRINDAIKTSRAVFTGRESIN